MARTKAMTLGACLALSNVLAIRAGAAAPDGGVIGARGDVAPFVVPGPRVFAPGDQARWSDRTSPLRFDAREAKARDEASAVPESEAAQAVPDRARERARPGRVQAFELEDGVTVLSNRPADVPAGAPPMPAIPERRDPPRAAAPEPEPPPLAKASVGREARAERPRPSRDSDGSSSLLPKLAVLLLLVAGGLWLRVRNAS